MLTVRNVSAGYGSEDVLKGVSLTAHPGEVHGILGVNGSGKTTLFRTINGWLPKSEGRISSGPKPLHPSEIGYLETDPYFYPYLKGREYLELLRLKQPHFDIKSWNEIFDLPLDRLADEYSTGMKKKLALLGILAQNRNILILDEPLSGVDIESNIKFQEIILRLKQGGKIILLSSHLLEALTQICDKISLLSQGIIQRTFHKEEFAQLHELVNAQIKSKLDNQLDQLFAD